MTGPRSQWLVRRVFETEQGPIARWWNIHQGWGEPEDATVFPRRIEAEECHKLHFGYTYNWTAQRVEDAFAEVRAAYAR